MNWRKVFINSLFFVGFIYGIFILRYVGYLITPGDWKKLFLVYKAHVAFYFYPKLNAVSFLLHVVGGSIAFLSAPFLFRAFKKDTYNFYFLVRLYLLSSFFVLFPWPLLSLKEVYGFSLGLVILLTIEIIMAFLLARAYYFFRQDDRQQFMIFFIYLYCFQFGTSLYRFIYRINVQLFPTPASSHLVFNPCHLSIDLAFFISLVIGISLAKILMYVDVINKS